MTTGYIAVYKNKQGIIRFGQKPQHTKQMVEFEARKNKTKLYGIAKFELI